MSLLFRSIVIGSIILLMQACGGSGGEGPPTAVSAANNAPTLTLDAAISVPEEGTTSVATATASDSDGDTLTISIIGGADASSFSLDSATGAITFNTVPDFETPGSAAGTNEYAITVRVSDGRAADETDVVVTVTDVIENNTPTLTLDAAISVAENGTAVGTAAASDADSEDTLTFSVSGGADAAMFTIGASTGVITFNSAPDYEATGSAAGTNDYAMTVQVSDGTIEVTQNVVVSVTDVAEPPAVGNVIDGPLQHAKVYADYNGNNIHDANEPHAMTDVDGGYSLSQNMPVPTNYTMVVEMTADTIDAISGESYADSPVVLKAASGSAVVTPLTTILEVAKSADPTYTAEKLATAMGLPTGVDVSSYNPFAAGADQTTAHEVETVFQQVMTAQLVVAEAMKGLADVAGATDVTAKDASEAAMSAIAGMVVASAVTVDLADSTQVGELKEQAKTKAVDLGITVDAAVADAMLTSASNAVATVSAALSNLTPDTFGTSAASSVSRLKHDAAGEVKAASVAVAAADLSAPGADLLAIVTAQLDSSLTLDEGAGVDAAVTANVSEVDGYLGIRNLDFELGGAGWEVAGTDNSYQLGTNSGNTFPTDGGNPGGYWSMDAANNETGYALLVTAGGNPAPLADSGLEAGKIYKVMQDSKIFSTKDGFEAKVGGMKVEFYKSNSDGSGYDSAGDTGDMRPALIDSGTDWATYEFEYEIPSDATHIKFVPLWGNDNHIGVDNIVIGTAGRLPPPRIVGSNADGMIERFNSGETKIQNTDSWNVQVGEWYGGGSAYIGFFQLPDLGQVADPFTNSELGVRLHEMGNPSWDADLALVRVSDNTDILHETDYDLESTLIQSSFISTAVRDALDSGEADHNIYTSAAANATLTAELNKAYDGGAGIGKYVVMRIAKSGDLPTGESFKIISRNAGESNWWPTIYYNADPMPGDDTRTTLASVQANTTTGGTVSGVPVMPAVSFTVTAADATSVSFHSSGFSWSADAQVAAVANGDGTWTATIDPGFGGGVEYKWIVDGVEEDLSTAYRAGECADDNIAAYDDTYFNRTWAADAGNVTGDIANACAGTTASTDGGDTSTPADTTAPVITLIGDAAVSVEQGSTYSDAGATADTGETVIIDASAVDTSTIGSYSVTFNVTDAAMNAAEQKTRTVNVIAVPVGTVSITKVIETNCTSPFIKAVELYVEGTVDFTDPNVVSMGYMLNGAAFADRQDYFDEIRALGKVTNRYVYIVRDLAMTQADFPSTTLTEGENAVTVGASTNGDDGYQVVMNGVVVSQFGADGQDADDSIGTSADWAHNDTYFERKPGSIDDGTFSIDHWNSQPEDYLDDFGVCARSTSDPKTETLETVITLGNYKTIASATAISSYAMFDSTQTYTDAASGTVEYKMTPVAGVDGGTTQAVANVVSFTGDPEIGILMINPDDASQVWASNFVAITATGETTNTWGPHTGVQNFGFVLKLDSDDSVVLSSFSGSIIEPEGAVNTMTASDLEGYWTYDTESPFGASIALGPSSGSAEYFSVSDADETGSRACQMDDIFQFGSGGGFTNHLGDQTYLEALNDSGAGFNQADTEGCGTPVAPHDGKHADPATWAWVDAAPNNQIQVSGVGAHIGLAKLHNGGELGLPNEATTSIYPITYDVVSSTATTMTLQMVVNSNYWTFRLKKTVAPPDTTPPVITLTGESAVTITVGSTYVDAGASADGGETVTVDSSAVDTSTAGTYTVSYTASDAAGNEGTATRSVTVEAAATGPTSAITVLPDVVYDAATPNRVIEGVTVKGYVDSGGLRWIRPPISGEAPGTTYGTGGGSDDVNIGTVSFRKMRVKLPVALPARFELDTTGQTFTHTGNWVATGDAHSYCASMNGRLATAAEVKANLVPHLAAGTWDATFGWPRHRYDHYWTGTGARAYAIELWPGWTQGSTVADAEAAGYSGFEGNKRVYAADAAQVTAGVLVEGEPSDYVRLATTNFGGGTETVVNDIDDVFAPENWANYYPLCVAPLE